MVPQSRLQLLETKVLGTSKRSSTLPNIPRPRTWALFSKMLKLKRSKPRGCEGSFQGRVFARFLELGVRSFMFSALSEKDFDVVLQLGCLSETSVMLQVGNERGELLAWRTDHQRR